MAKSGRRLTIEQGMELINSATIKYRFVEFDGITVGITDSLRTFRKGCDCVGCGAKGSHFRLKEDGQLRLFVRVNRSTCRQLTSDHIWPRSKGGSDGFWNRQPMCQKCNGKKSVTGLQTTGLSVRFVVKYTSVITTKD
jgi:hypothetical protein